MSQPLISVIIPCYNQAKFLTEALDSVQQLRYANWECIVINDGSDDDTETIALAYSQKDKRIKYIRKGNGGLSSARNSGLGIAKGDYIQFLDADDILEPEKFSIQLDGADPKDAKDVVQYSQCVYGEQDNIHEESGDPICRDFKSEDKLSELIMDWEDSLIIPCHSFLFSSNFFKEGIRFDETLANHEDFDCWLTIFSRKPTVKFNSRVLCRYRKGDNSMSSNMKLMGEGFIKVLDKHLNQKSYSHEIHSVFKHKRLSVLQRYRRFDLMNVSDKLESRNVLFNYYRERLKQKIGNLMGNG